MTAHIPFDDATRARLERMSFDQAGLHVIAREVLPFSAARTQAWHDARRTTVGASEIAAVMGVQSAPVSAFTVWWRKRLGWLTEPEEHMRIGLMLEGVIGDVFRERRPDVFLARPRGAMYVHPSFDHVACSPDYLGVMEHMGHTFVVPVECKSDEGGDWGDQGTDQVPAHHRMQALWQACVFGAPFAFIARMAHKRFRWYVIENDDGVRAEVNSWIVGARDFLHSVGTGDAPEPDEHESTEDTLKAIHPTVDIESRSIVDDDLATEYLAAVGARRHANAKYRRAVNRLRAQMGSCGEAASPGFGLFVRRERFPRRAYDVRESTVDRLMPVMRRDDGGIATDH